MAFGDGQGWSQLGELGLALLLSAIIGCEREIRQKSAGLRTHTVVGFAAALIMQVSKYGFADVIGDHVVLDPSRIAAQIVSGIGFIGGGLIFVRRDVVRGLTTAAIIWLVAAVGMAAGAGLWQLAVAATAGHLVIVLAFTPLAARLPRSKYAPWRLRLTYLDRHGVLRAALTACTDRGFSVAEVHVEQPRPAAEPPVVTVLLTLTGRRDIAPLTAALAGLDGVLAVAGDDASSGSA
ncbi:MgtC/SapB family protein [Dactylosporangium sp. CA-092794]|uniref:MgtC/SapB family protein n=1 Tax=Dactylosporangium sp. CA-092794 TaxID=3239929 RepID=UPI003D8FF906